MDFRKRNDYAFLVDGLVRLDRLGSAPTWPRGSLGIRPLSQPRVGTETKRDFRISS